MNQKGEPRADANPWDLFLSMPTICAVESPELTAIMQDFAGLLEVDGVLDGLPLPTDRRAYIALLGMAFIAWADQPAAELRRRADLVLTPEGRGPVTDQTAFASALRRTADLFEMSM